MDTSEKRFEQDIETYFLNHGCRKVLPSTYDKEKMLFSDVLEEFVSTCTLENLLGSSSC